VRSLSRCGPLVRALLTFVALADVVLSAELWALRHHTARWAVTTTLDVLAPVRPVAAVAVAAAALYLATRPKRAFRRILMALATGAAVLSMLAGNRALIFAGLVVAAVALFAGSLWPEEGHATAGRLGWSLLGLAAGAVVLSGWILVGLHRGPHVNPLFTVPLTLAFGAAVAGVALLDRNPPLDTSRDFPGALLVYRLSARSTLAPFALMRDKLQLWTADRAAFLALGCRVGVALALGSAVGPPEAARRLDREFRVHCHARGWRPAFYQVPEETAASLPGTRRLLIGSEAIVDLDGFTLRGGAMANLRRHVTKARRIGLSAELLSEQELPQETRAAMRRLAAELAERSPLGEMSFSVGRIDDPAQVERTVALARETGGDLVAYVTWLWLPAARTIVLDEIKRSRQAPSGATELLIATSLLELRGRAERASLALAPITGVRQSARLAAFEAHLRNLLGMTSASPGLYAFKAKFNPRWEPRYLVVERWTDLAPVLLATLLLHYPDAIRRSWGRATAARPASR
jgi:phosphatidylglycerol lysyltransferase